MNIKDQFKSIDDYFSPKIITEVNDQFVKLDKIKGEDIPCHNHEDELFYIFSEP